MDKDSFIITIFGVAIAIGVAFAIPEYGRYQTLQNSNNEVHVNEIKILQQEQLIKVEHQKAEIRIEEARGIAQAQQIVNATLTDRYLQHEAIKAQFEMAGSPSHTQIYIPTGQNGIPIVKTID